MHPRLSSRVAARLRALLRWPRRCPSTTARPAVEALEGRDLPAAGVREQYALELINRLRTNPQAELSRLLNSADPDVNSALRYFNVDRNLLQQQWSSLTPVPPLAWSDALGLAALRHSQLMLQYDQQSHQFPGEGGLLERFGAAGYNARAAAENVFAFGKNVFHTHAAFAIDWGGGPGGIQSPPGHRINLMDATYTAVGVGLVDATPGRSTGPLLVTQDFAAPLFSGSPFLLGVVYRDANANGLYDSGEGLSDVTVSTGALTTTTGPGGGYQIAVSPGSYTVTFSGGALSGPLSRSVSVGGANVKLDLNATVTSPVQFSAAAYRAAENAGTATVTVTRSGDLASAVSVRLTTADGTARAGADYTAVDTTVSFAAQETQKVVTISVLDNSLSDGDRTVTLRLASPTGSATLGTPSQAVLTIEDDDQPGQLDFAATTFRSPEGAALATVTVARSRGTRGEVTVAYSAAAGTAADGADFTAVTGTLTFADGQASRTFTVPILEDGQLERAETVRLSLSAPTGGAVLGSSAASTLRIDDNDRPTVEDSPAPSLLPLLGMGIARSREYYEGIVTGAYDRYLGRAPDAGGLDYWATQMQVDLTQERLEAGFLGSPEYIANHGGEGAGWVRGMYRDLLGREAAEGEVRYWVDQLAGGLTTFRVAYGFAASAEREGQRVRTNYQTLLGRAPSEGEVLEWVSAFLAGMTNETMIAGFVISPEYYNHPEKGQGNAATWALSAYRDILARDPHPEEIASVLRVFGLG